MKHSKVEIHVEIPKQTVPLSISALHGNFLDGTPKENAKFLEQDLKDLGLKYKVVKVLVDGVKQ